MKSSSYDAGIAAYERGHYEIAMYDFEKRAVQGDPVAQFCLGYMYKQGKGVPLDLQKAIGWYTKAAEQDYVPAQNDLGVVYLRLWEELEFRERKLGKDDLNTDMMSYFDRTFRWLREAAKHGNST